MNLFRVCKGVQAYNKKIIFKFKKEKKIYLLKKLCETPGIAGYEDRIRKVIMEELEKVTDEVKIDKY